MPSHVSLFPYLSCFYAMFKKGLSLIFFWWFYLGAYLRLCDGFELIFAHHVKMAGVFWGGWFSWDHAEPEDQPGESLRLRASALPPEGPCVSPLLRSLHWRGFLVLGVWVLNLFCQTPCVACFQGHCREEGPRSSCWVDIVTRPLSSALLCSRAAHQAWAAWCRGHSALLRAAAPFGTFACDHAKLTG